MQMMVGEFDRALATLRSFNERYPYRMETRPLYKHIMSQKHIMDQALRYSTLKSYSKALKRLRQLYPEYPNCDRIRWLIMECLIHSQGLTDDAELYFDQFSNEDYLYVDRFRNKCLELYVRSLIGYYNCEFDDTIVLLGELFSIDIGHVRGRELEKKTLEILSTFEKVDNCMTKEEWEGAINCLTQLMEFDSSNQSLTRAILINQAKTYTNMSKIPEAEKALEQLLAMGANPDHMELRNIREKIHCVKNVGEVNDANLNPNFRDLKLPDYQMKFNSEDLRKLLSIAAQMNAYQILGLDSTNLLTQAQVEQASRQLIKRCHPDNFASNPEIHSCCVELFQHIKRAEELILVEIYNRLKSSTGI